MELASLAGLGPIFTEACQLVAPKSLWPQTIATKTNKALLSRVVVAIVAFLCPLFLYKNAFVLYLIVNVAIFCTKEMLGPTKKSW